MHQGVEYLTQWYFDTWTGGVEDWTLTFWLVNKLLCDLNHPWIEAQQCYIHFIHSGQLYTESAAWQGLKNSSWLLLKNHWSLPKYQDFSFYILQKIYGCKRGISIRGSLHICCYIEKRLLLQHEALCVFKNITAHPHQVMWKSVLYILTDIVNLPWTCSNILRQIKSKCTYTKQNKAEPLPRCISKN